MDGMNARTRILMAVAAVAIATGLSTTLWIRHGSAPVAAQHTKAAMISDATIQRAMQDSNLPLTGLIVTTVGDIVVLKGDAPDTATADSAARVVRSLGVQRVANMIRVPTPPNDDAIRREAELRLTKVRSLDGCILRVSCKNGVLHVSGVVHTELQQDAVAAILRSVNGTQNVDTTGLELVQLTASR
jgi:osmotically-inducible protein OsmY